MDHNVDEDDIDIDAESGLCYEFECPDCNAHNPMPDGFGDGSEISCCYCGAMFAVKIASGRVKLKEL